MASLRKAIAQFGAQAFAERHGGYKESQSAHSQEYLLPCPKCSSSRLRWNATKNDWGAWKCWGCRRSGDTIRLVELMEDVDDVDALNLVMDGYVGGNAPARLSTNLVIKPGARAQKLLRLPQIPWPSGVDVLADTPLHAPAWDYLRTRGITAELAAGWRIGWGRMGWLKDYLVFPVYMDGGLVYWQGRAAFNPDPSMQGRFEKTRNPKSKEGLATAQDVLFNYERAKASPHVVICEGPIDALKVGLNAVALFGKFASAPKVQRLLRCRTLRYTVYLDRGAKERQRAEELAEQLSAFAPTYIAEPPEGYDPGNLSREQNAHVIAHAPLYTGKQLQSLG